MSFAHILRSGERIEGGGVVAGQPREFDHRILNPKGYGYGGYQKLRVFKISDSEARDFWLEEGEHRPAAAAFEIELHYGGLFPPANRRVGFGVRVKIAVSEAEIPLDPFAEDSDKVESDGARPPNEDKATPGIRPATPAPPPDRERR